MKKNLSVLFAALLLTGCASTSSTWVVSQKTDQFTDVTSKTLSLNFSYGLYGMFKLALFVENHTNETLVGVRSFSSLPVGTVQIRVDQNPAWTISPQETPIFLSPSLPVSTNTAIAQAQSQAFTSIVGIMSPFTATTGDKARQILKQMVNGRIVRYRTIGINQQSSTTGEVVIEKSFLNGLKIIGIDPASL